MIQVSYTLHGADRGIRSEERHQQHVPRVGELVTFGFSDSYQIIDVLWHLPVDSDASVTVTAHELNWHEHIHDVSTNWQNAHDDR